MLKVVNVCVCVCVQGLKVTGEVDPERSGGQVYPSLVALLKASSQHFTTNIGKQVSPTLCLVVHAIYKHATDVMVYTRLVYSYMCSLLGLHSC